MIRILITLILVLTGCSNKEVETLNLNHEKVDEIYGVKVPNGVNAVYDTLENEYIIDTDGKMHDKILDISLILDNQTNINFIIYNTYKYSYDSISLPHSYQEKVERKKRRALSPSIVNLFIKNSISTIKYTYPLKGVPKNISYTIPFSNYYHLIQYSSPTPDILIANFLLANLQEDSEVIVQFNNPSTSSSIDCIMLSKNYQQLYSLLSFYQELSTTIPKKYNNIDIPLHINVLTDTTTRKTVITSRDITREYSSSDKDKFSYLEIINDNNKISPVMTFYFGYQSLKKLKLVVNNANNISEYMIHDDKGDYNQQLILRKDGEQILAGEGLIDFINSNIKNDSLVHYEFINYMDYSETIYVNPSQIKNMREISQIYRQLSPK